MVKVLDENPGDLIDHVGWRLWLATRNWQKEFVAGMREAGHDWFTDARATLLAYVARNGTPQSRIIERMGISKQAVQQLIDGLEADRTDLEEQLGKTAALAGEKVTYINSTGELRERLASDFGNLNMVMVSPQTTVEIYLSWATPWVRYKALTLVTLTFT